MARQTQKLCALHLLCPGLSVSLWGTYLLGHSGLLSETLTFPHQDMLCLPLAFLCPLASAMKTDELVTVFIPIPCRILEQWPQRRSLAPLPNSTVDNSTANERCPCLTVSEKSPGELRNLIAHAKLNEGRNGQGRDLKSALLKFCCCDFES